MATQIARDAPNQGRLHSGGPSEDSALRLRPSAPGDGSDINPWAWADIDSGDDPEVDISSHGVTAVLARPGC